MTGVRSIRVVVNGTEWRRAVQPRLLLSDFLREELGLTGTHVGCEHGVCGACTVLLNGEPVRSCLMLAVQADGAEVETVEGLARGGQLHPLQQAFQRHHAVQCGFCTPGFLVMASWLVRHNPKPTEAEIREALSGNLCRCTGYQNIVQAVMSAALESAAKASIRRHPSGSAEDPAREDPPGSAETPTVQPHAKPA